MSRGAWRVVWREKCGRDGPNDFKVAAPSPQFDHPTSSGLSGGIGVTDLSCIRHSIGWQVAIRTRWPRYLGRAWHPAGQRRCGAEEHVRNGQIQAQVKDTSSGLTHPMQPDPAHRRPSAWQASSCRSAPWGARLRLIARHPSRSPPRSATGAPPSQCLGSVFFGGAGRVVHGGRG